MCTHLGRRMNTMYFHIQVNKCMILPFVQMEQINYFPVFFWLSFVLFFYSCTFFVFSARHHRCLRVCTTAADAVSAVACTRYDRTHGQLFTPFYLFYRLCSVRCYSCLKHSIYLFHCARFVCVQSLCSTCHRHRHFRCHYCRWRNRCERTKGYNFTSSFSWFCFVISNALKRTESFFFLLFSCLIAGFWLVLCARTSQSNTSFVIFLNPATECWCQCYKMLATLSPVVIIGIDPKRLQLCVIHGTFCRRRRCHFFCIFFGFYFNKNKACENRMCGVERWEICDTSISLSFPFSLSSRYSPSRTSMDEN